MDSFLINNTSEKQRNRSRCVSHHLSEYPRTDLEAQIETTKRVLQLEKNSGFSITQVNGQRKLGPPANWIGPPPNPDCEVFVGKLPRDLYESEIYPIFQRIGEIYEIRLMMDFSGTNRGYCFVMYTNTRDAHRAIQQLNNYEIRSGRRIGVLASINNCRLCVTHLPMILNTEEFIKKIFETTNGVGKVAVYRLTDDRPKNALIFYKTHIDAAMARRRLVPERSNFINGAEITIDWAHPNLSPENVVEECGILDENGRVKMRRRFIDLGQKNCSRDGKFFKENVIISNTDGDKSILTKSELSLAMKMNKKKVVNTRKKPLHSTRLNNANDQQQQQGGTDLNQRIMQNHFNHFHYPCKNKKFQDILKTQDINGNFNNYNGCTNKFSKTLGKNDQTTELMGWVASTNNADPENQINVPRIVCNNFSHLPNNLYNISQDSTQINLQGNEMYTNAAQLEFTKIARPNQRFYFNRGTINDEPLVQMIDNKAVRLVMQNIQTNFIFNRENLEQSLSFEESDNSVIQYQALDINSYGQICPVASCVNQEKSKIITQIPHNIHQVENDPAWEKRIVALTFNDFYDYRQPRPILNRFS